MKKLNSKGYGAIEVVLAILVCTIAVGVGAYVYSAQKLHKLPPVDNTIELQTTRFKIYKLPDIDISVEYPENWKITDSWKTDKKIVFVKSINPLPYFSLSSAPESNKNQCDRSLINTINKGIELTVAGLPAIQLNDSDDKGQLILTCIKKDTDIYALKYGYDSGEENLHLDDYLKFIDSLTFEQ
jgi:hypothetical protein